MQWVNATDFTVTGTTAAGSAAPRCRPRPARTRAARRSARLFHLGGRRADPHRRLQPGPRPVTGSVSGAMGSGNMPASTNASTAFTSTDGSMTFILTTGSNPFAAGNSFAVAVFRCGAADPPSSASSPAARRSRQRPLLLRHRRERGDLHLRAADGHSHGFLGDGSSAAGQVLTAANLPVYSAGRRSRSGRSGRRRHDAGRGERRARPLRRRRRDRRGARDRRHRRARQRRRGARGVRADRVHRRRHEQDLVPDAAALRPRERRGLPGGDAHDPPAGSPLFARSRRRDDHLARRGLRARERSS